MTLKWAVTLRAGNSHGFPGRRIRIGRSVIVLFEFGHVAIRALRIPVHAQVLPEPPFVRLPRFTLVNVEPVFLFRVISGVDDLEAAVRKGGQELDERLDANHGDSSVEGRNAVRPDLPHDQPAPFLDNLRREEPFFESAWGIKCRVVLPRIYEAVRVGMLGVFPVFIFFKVAGFAGERVRWRKAGLFY